MRIRVSVFLALNTAFNFFPVAFAADAAVDAPARAPANQAQEAGKIQKNAEPNAPSANEKPSGTDITRGGDEKALEGAKEHTAGTEMQTTETENPPGGAAKAAEGDEKASDGEEKPTTEKPTTEKATVEKPTAEKPTAEKPTIEKPTTEKATTENPHSESAESAAENGVSQDQGDSEDIASNDPVVLLHAANIANRKNQCKEAVSLCNRVLENAEKSKAEEYKIPALTIRGLAYVVLRKYAEGIDDLSVVIDAQKNGIQFPLYSSRALAYLQINDFAKAIADCDIAIKAKTKDQQFWWLRGVAFQRSKRLDRALSDVNHAISLLPEGPNTPVLLSTRADIYSSMGEDDAALKDLNRVLKLTPKDPQAWMNRACLYVKRKDWEHAVADLDNVIDFALMGSLSNDALKMRAEAAKKCGKFKVSIEDFSSLLAGYPKEVDYWYGRADAHFGAGEYADALKDVDKAIALDATQSRFFELRAKINDALKSTDKAEKDRQHAAELQPKGKPE